MAWHAPSTVQLTCKAAGFHSHLLITSPRPAPPRCAQLFFRCHIVCFLGFFLFSCCHYAQSYTYFVPGELK